MLREQKPSLPLAFLALVRAGYRRGGGDRGGGEESVGGRSFFLFDGHAHVTSVTTLATVALIFTDALLSGNTGIPTATAGPLSIAPLLALAAALAARLGRQIRLLVVDGADGERSGRGDGWLARSGKGSRRHGTGDAGFLGFGLARLRRLCLGSSLWGAGFGGVALGSGGIATGAGGFGLGVLELGGGHQARGEAILGVVAIATNFYAFVRNGRLTSGRHAGCLARRVGSLAGVLEETAGGRGTKPLLPSGRHLVFAVAVDVACSTSGGCGVGPTAEGGSGSPAVGDIGYLTEAHELDGNILVLLGHTAADGRVRRG